MRLASMLGVCALAALALGACNGGGGADGQDWVLVDSLELSAEIEAVWPEAPSLPPVVVDSTQDRPPRMAIYLDISSPMSGFVPPPGMEDDVGVIAGGELRVVAQWTSDHLGRAYPDAPIEWHGVAENVSALPQSPPVFRREIFTGTESRLDLAIEALLTDLRTGRSSGGAIITDLLGTGESTGAPSVARRLKPWLVSAERRSGDFHFGLIGVRGTYWGAFHRTHCPSRRGMLGCWFSERMPGWKPRLQEPVGVPFYVLLFGRSAEKLNEIANSVRGDAATQEIEAVWELLTEAGSEEPNATVNFEAMPEGEPGQTQYALLRNGEDGTYRCQRPDPVELRGTFANGSRFGATAVSLVAPGPNGAPSPFTVELDGERIEVRVDCGVVRESNPPPALRLNIVGNMQPADRPNWEDWSTPDDNTREHPGKTLQLRYFVDETRVAPMFYRIDLPVLAAGQP